MRKLRLFIAIGAILAMSATAFAQDDDDDNFGGDDSFGDSSAGDSSADNSSSSTTDTSSSGSTDTGSSTTLGGDFGQTDGAWGFQVSTGYSLGAGMGAVPVTVPAVGVRQWKGDQGLEGGVVLAFVSDRSDAADNRDTDILFGVHGGWMNAFGVYDHMSVFWEPEVEILFFAPGSDALENQWQVNLLGNVGTEIRLGILGLPRIGLTAKIGGGLQIADDGDGLDFGLTIGRTQQTGLRGMLEGQVGFVFYK